LKSGDVITAVASLALVFILVMSVLSIALVPMNSASGVDVTSIVSVLVSALIVGYVFAGKIREESRMMSIGKIAVLSVVVVVFVVMMVFGAVGYYNAVVDDYLRNTYSTGSWTNHDWFAYGVMKLFEDTALFTVSALALGFVGLYLGSIRKPSAKTKE
jgi:hypothetical protein